MQECLIEGEELARPDGKSSRESVAQTLLVALLVALVCSTVVSSAVYLLRPMQLGYQLLDRNRAVVVAAGLADPDAADREVVARFVELESRVIDLDAVEPAADVDGRTYDHWDTADARYVAHPIPAAMDEAGLRVRPRLVPVFVRRDDGAIARLVLPVHGRGMWSTLHGYVAVGPDLNTVERLVISGASVTSAAVGNMVRYWMGEDAYGPWLRRLRNDAGIVRDLLNE
jgi:Na+-transporting NADH:ubiquinone oxidoreductase subunit C